MSASVAVSVASAVRLAPAVARLVPVVAPERRCEALIVGSQVSAWRGAPHAPYDQRGACATVLSHKYST